jgi:hypothetical protein
MGDSGYHLDNDILYNLSDNDLDLLLAEFLDNYYNFTGHNMDGIGGERNLQNHGQYGQNTSQYEQPNIGGERNVQNQGQYGQNPSQYEQPNIGGERNVQNHGQYGQNTSQYEQPNIGGEPNVQNQGQYEQLNIGGERNAQNQGQYDQTNSQDIVEERNEGQYAQTYSQHESGTVDPRQPLRRDITTSKNAPCTSNIHYVDNIPLSKEDKKRIISENIALIKQMKSASCVEKQNEFLNLIRINIWMLRDKFVLPVIDKRKTSNGNEGPYKCRACPEFFNRQSPSFKTLDSIKRHYAAHIMPIITEHYCIECDYSCARTNYFHDHMVTKHGICIPRALKSSRRVTAERDIVQWYRDNWNYMHNYSSILQVYDL